MSPSDPSAAWTIKDKEERSSLANKQIHGSGGADQRSP